MNSVSTYDLRVQTGVMSHGKFTVGLFRDGELTGFEEPDFTSATPVDAQVKSGDYFITLATKLDWLGRDTDFITRSRIEDIVSDLIFLHETYTIEPKKEGSED